MVEWSMCTRHLRTANATRKFFRKHLPRLHKEANLTISSEWTYCFLIVVDKVPHNIIVFPIDRLCHSWVMENAIVQSSFDRTDSSAQIFDPHGRQLWARGNGIFHHMPFIVRQNILRIKHEPNVDVTDQFPARLAERIRLNVAGKKYDIPYDIFQKHPSTLLGDPVKLSKFFDLSTQEFYFDRDRSSFESIIQYYQTGTLYRPLQIPLRVFVAECRFFELDEPALLQICEHEGFRPYKKLKLPKNRFLRELWLFVDDPHSSLAAKVFSLFSMLMIILSVVVLCTQSMPQFRGITNATRELEVIVNGSFNDTDGDGIDDAAELAVIYDYAQFSDPFFIIATVCIAWFTIEFILRVISCPSKKNFLKSPINIIDLIAIVPYYIDITVTVVCLSRGISSHSKASIMGILRVLRVIRIFRIVRLSRYSNGLRILGETFIVSLRELGLLMLFLGIGVVLFSSSMFYAEIGMKDTQFNSIPESFWWAIVTMTTVGYGDVTPKGLFGKIVGACCAISGLMAIALPIPVIVANFNAIYIREKLRPEIEDLLGDVLNVHRVQSSVHVHVPHMHIHRNRSKISKSPTEDLVPPVDRNGVNFHLSENAAQDSAMNGSYTNYAITVE
ncbi:potassium voltage-gated channel subfamily A member 7-like [Paramacrobiotus metropolitanus]|uniref:potassium voltage-gated channel subfamily A member 7-like n=1 Tax=Paramacrobiotus metropolitanus TaxID=2943436 RepID=UPI0024456627|nr:potassium voltage-gated channel subfamily A member 7-like [Paramacrobiotus metropolitanus]XP_055357692.1 potassium voltage-gated channel subfamily A member 7-like [Paramacrobiotus metropolitanus]